MFAAPSKNLNVKIAQSNNNTAPLTATASDVKEPTKIITATVVIPPLSSFIPTPTTPTATSSSSSRTSKPMSEVSLRAEKLRLEAERAQFEVDQSRIDDEKVSNKFIFNNHDFSHLRCIGVYIYI